MRRFLLASDFKAMGLTRSAVRWGERNGKWRGISYGVYGEGPDDPSELDRAIAPVIATNGVASGRLAGVLHRLDAVELRGTDITVPPHASGRRGGVRRRVVAAQRVTTVDGVRCTDALQTLIDLAAELTDTQWEQAFESALRRRLLRVDDLCGSRQPRVMRVLALRGPGAPATESLLETLMVQLARTVPGLTQPTRQFRIVNSDGVFVARVDLCWPDLGIFIELDGQQHKDQPVYDARRETAVVAATGWLCGRFTWREVADLPITTARRLAALAERARRRPLPA